MLKKITLVLILFISFTGYSFLSAKDNVPLIPREVLFGNPEISSVTISPDATYIAFLAPSDKGVMNVWVQKIGSKDKKMVTKDTHRGIRGYGWTIDGKQIFYLQDKGGDENFHLYLSNIATGLVRDLTPFQGRRAQNFISDEKFPEEILLGLNIRDKRSFDMYRVNLKTGAIVLDTKNPGMVQAWFTNNDFQITASMSMNPKNGSTVINIRNGKDKPWRVFKEFPFGENGEFRGYSPKGDSVYITTSMGGDTTRLVEMDIKTGKEIRTIAFDKKADVGGVSRNPVSKEIEYVSFTYKKTYRKFFNKKFEEDFKFLKKKLKGQTFIASRDLKNKTWIVGETGDSTPVKYYLFKRDKKTLDFLMTNRPYLEKYKLSEMKPVIIKARDGLNLVSYLSLPVGAKKKNLPFVLLVHGGPWARDYWGYNPIAQMLTNRGYGVLSVNFRGSTGFGKKFLNAGNKEWGVGKMQHDLSDAVNWLKSKKFADPKRICIMGGSYGGYATLAGLTFTPSLYKCGVDIVGPSNIRTLFKSIPPYWMPMKNLLIKRVGDVEKDEKFNRKISPLFHVDKIKAPLLIGQGKNDPRVNVAESDQIFKAMKKKNLYVKYIIYTDEGHGFRRPENSLDFWGHVDEFLAKHLKGRCEPYKKIKGSTGIVK